MAAARYARLSEPLRALAHKAMHEAVMCVEKIAGVKGVHPMDVTKIPGCTYCAPQVASP